VRTLRSLNFAAMALWLVKPARMISLMMGRTLTANRLAFARKALCHVAVVDISEITDPEALDAISCEQTHCARWDSAKAVCCN
jgi:hypothetical protein